MEKFVSFFSKIDSTVNDSLKFISLGGGMFSRMDEYIEEQLPFNIPSFKDYAKNSIKYLIKTKIRINY